MELAAPKRVCAPKGYLRSVQWGCAMESDDYRQIARDYLIEAQRLDLTEERRGLLRWMADQWVQIAEEAEFLGDPRRGKQTKH
jgi:hypothetical protein